MASDATEPRQPSFVNLNCRVTPWPDDETIPPDISHVQMKKFVAVNQFGHNYFTIQGSDRIRVVMQSLNLSYVSHRHPVKHVRVKSGWKTGY